MIRLIASDMDGTLLSDDKKLDPEIFPLIRELTARGVVFAPASGRQVCSLKRFFAPVLNDIYIIGENGAIITYGKKEIFASVMDKAVVRALTEAILSMGKHTALLCGKRQSYTDDPATVRLLGNDRFRYNVEYREDLLSVTEDIIKVSVVDGGSVLENSFPILYPKFKDELCVTVSGFNCMDFMNPGVSKGAALGKIKEYLRIGYEETLVFGDNFNDIEMFGEGYFSYAMENSAEEVRAKARYTAGSNNTNWIIEEIKRLCLK